jgi:hypothetical protein
MTFVLRQVSSGCCFTPSEQWLLFYVKYAVVVVLRQVSSGCCFTLGEQWILFYAKLAVVVVLRQVSSGCCFTPSVGVKQQALLNWRKTTTNTHLT